MEKGLAAADIVLLIWSSSAACSFATREEWTSALAREISERKRRLGVVRLDDAPLPELLRTRQFIDARAGREQAIRAVLHWLAARRGAGRLVYLPDYRPEHFVGRGAYLDTLRDALVDEPALFLLSGAPGCGKSTLALAFAWDVQRDFDAVVFQTCGQRDADLIAAELAAQLLGDKVAQLPPDQKAKAAKGWLRQRRSLLILDDIWGDVAPLLPGPPVSVLFTSRRATLPQLSAEQIATVESFSPEEAEAALRKVLGDDTMDQHRDALLDFAARVGWLPFAIIVGADLLRRTFDPLDEAARGLALRRLRNEIHDVPGLLDRAVQAQGHPERRLLKAAAACAPEGFWLPLALDIAGLTPEDGAAARDNLVNASLLRVLDRDRRRFQLHALLREHLCNDALRPAHAAALERLFKDWETRWRDCRECLAERPWRCTRRKKRSAWNWATGTACRAATATTR